jgi:D-glycero-D-manno-heptose 1,7-bisphosphate phosphatase
MRRCNETPHWTLYYWSIRRKNVGLECARLVEGGVDIFAMNSASTEPTSQRRRAVFLDRDGIINRAVVRDGKPYPPRSLADLEIPEDVPPSLEALRRAGYLLIVVTNQPDVARGTQKREVVDAINARLLSTLPLDEIKVCFGTDSETCACYKPRPGMLLEAANQYGIDLQRSYMVGDRWRDVGAGQAAGCFTIFVDYGYQERRPDNPDAIVRTFGDAIPIILSQCDQEIP